MYKKQANNWCFTMYTEPVKINTERVAYYIYQKEKCPSTGRDHWQGYIEFKRGLRGPEVQKVLGDENCHVEPRKGNQEQAIVYCQKLKSKIGPCISWGTPKRQGARSDLDSIAEALIDSASTGEIIHEFKGNAIKHVNMIRTARMVLNGDCPIDAKTLFLRKIKETLEAGKNPYEVL